MRILVSGWIVGCAGGGDAGPDGTDPEMPEERVFVDRLAGPAQKGPFLSGTPVSAQALDTAGVRTGPVVSTVVAEDGTYALDGLTWEAATWVEASGMVFDEINAKPSKETFTLASVVLPLEGQHSAVNLFTDVAAYRIATLMGEGATFDDAQAQTISEMTPLWGTQSPPASLDLLGGPGSAAEELELLLYSAAFMDEGIDAKEWELVRFDFADNGLLDGKGAEVHEDILDTLFRDPLELLEAARTNLGDAYRTPPDPDPTQFGLLITGCLAHLIANPTRTVCEGQITAFELSPGDTKMLEWRPDIPGLHAVVIDQPCPSGSYVFDTTRGGFSSGSFTEVTLNQSDVPGNAPYDWSITANCEGDILFDVTPYRITDGSQGTPARIRAGQEVDGRASNGTRNPDRIAHYVVEGAPGSGEVVVWNFNSGTGLNSQNVRVRLYAGSTPDDRELLESDDGVGSLTVPFELKGGPNLYIDVQNQAARAVEHTYAQYSLEVR